MLSLLVLSLPARAWLGDDGTYFWSESGTADPDAPVHTWVDVPSDPNAVMLGISTADDATETLDEFTGSTFTFYGRTYDMERTHVSSNGLVLFDAAGQFVNTYCCSGQPIPSVTVAEPSIMAYWTDLYPGGGGGVWTLDTGTERIIHWEAVPFCCAQGSNSVQLGLRPDGSFRISIEAQSGAAQSVAIGHQSDFNRGNELFFGMTPPVAPVTWVVVPEDDDDDGDGFTDATDCDDDDPDVNPSVVDTDCDGVVSGCGPLNGEADQDFDGFRVCEGDCDDSNSSTNPAGFEFCDGQDNNCDGTADEGLQLDVWFEDLDFDGWGDDQAESLEACFPPFGWGMPGDCDDDDPFVNPFQPEDCDDTTDRDCDGDTTAGAQDASAYQVDADGDGFGVPPTTFVCDLPADAASAPGDCDDTDPAIHPDVEEIPFDDIDQDCDGREEDDRDEDGLSDADEYAYGSDWRDHDTDDDTVLDGREYELGTDLTLADSDADGLDDATEIGTATPPDSDGDGVIDALDPDDDGDLWPTILEGNGDFDEDGTPDHLDTDSDDDGIPDAEETVSSRLVVDELPDDEEKNCGCSSSSGPMGAFALLPLLALVRRRRS